MIEYYATLENGKTVYIDLETSKLYLFTNMNNLIFTLERG